MAESGPVNADKQQQLQARAPETTGSDSEFLPPGAMGILDLQRKAGNRAVTSAIASGSLWSAPGARPMPMLQLMPAVQRWAGNRAASALRAKTIQREAPNAAPAKSQNTDLLASRILHRINKAVRVAHGAMQHVPPARADELIGLVAAYAKAYPDFTNLQRILLGEYEDMYELLAPWGYVGRSIKVTNGKLADDQPVESLLQALAAWRADDARARKKRRANTKGTFGYYDREITTAEMARDDAQVDAGPSRDTPADPWEDTPEGTRGNRRLGRQDIRNQRALGKMAGIKNQGPGGFIGMAIGGVVGAIHPGMDAQQGAEAGMQAGALLDAVIMVHAAAGEMAGVGAGTGQGHTDASHTAKAPERESPATPDLPGGAGRQGGAGVGRSGSGGGGAGGSGRGGGRPGDTQPGQGALGPAGQGARPVTMGVGSPGSAGAGARPRVGVGHLEPVPADAVIASFNRNPLYVRHSTSYEWHRRVWIWELSRSGKWDFEKGPAPEPPMAFHLTEGMMQVNDVAWFESRGTLNEILRPHERVGSGGGGGSGGGATSGGAGGGNRGGGGTAVGHTAAPGGDPGPARSGKTQVGVPLGPGGTAGATGASGAGPTPLKVPDGPPPVPPGNLVRPATRAEAMSLFKKAPHLVHLVGDRGDFHQYMWELQNFYDGKRVTSTAPAAFWIGDQIRVHGDSWLGQGGKLEEVMKPFSPGKPAPRQPNALEMADTQAGAGGGTNVSIVPGLDKKK